MGFIPDILINSLENQYPPLNIPRDISESDTVYIMVLGAGLTGTSDLSANNELSASSICRLVEGIRIHRLISGSKIVFSGYSSGQLANQADIMEQAAISLGVEASHINKVNWARNTSDEANRFYTSFGKRGSLIIVTDAIHMPRAMKLFRKAGLNPIASPANYLNRNEPFIPFAINIRIMEMVIHEYLGMVWNYAGGY